MPHLTVIFRNTSPLPKTAFLLMPNDYRIEVTVHGYSSHKDFIDDYEQKKIMLSAVTERFINLLPMCAKRVNVFYQRVTPQL